LHAVLHGFAFGFQPFHVHLEAQLLFVLFVLLLDLNIPDAAAALCLFRVGRGFFQALLIQLIAQRLGCFSALQVVFVP